MTRRVSGDRVRSFIQRHVDFHPSGIIALTGRKLGVTRDEVKEHLRQLIAEGKVSRLGSSFYGEGPELGFINDLRTHSEEDVVYRERIGPFLAGLPENVERICYYGFTEMYNNAVDHSEGTSVVCNVELTPYAVRMLIKDNGVGIFAKIRRETGIADNRQVLLELAKGGLTTDPERHSGQGIFFTSRAFDMFCLMTDEAYYSHHKGQERDWFMDGEDRSPGTVAVMVVDRFSDRVLRELFDRYTGDRDLLEITKTHAPVRMARFGNEDLVSRSQARRLLLRFDRYEEVFLDFAGVDFVGQGFADEIFRVFAQANPGTKIVAINTSESILRMIRYVQSGNLLADGDSSG